MRIRTVQIGVTDACNLACTMCTRARAFAETPGRSPGFMDRGLFRKALADLSDSVNEIDLLFLAWLGESFLHPLLPELVGDAFAANRANPFFRWLSINTNGSLLGEAARLRWLDLARGARDAGRLHLSFSLDAAGEEAHRRVKGSGSAEAIRRDIAALLADNVRDPAFTFNLTFLVLPENAHEAGDFVRIWSDILAGIGARFRVSHDDVAADAAENLVILKRAVLPDQPAADALHRAACARAGLLPGSPSETECGPRPDPGCGPAPPPAGMRPGTVAPPAAERSVPAPPHAAPSLPAAGPPAAKFVRADSISKNYADETIFQPQPRRPPCPALWHYPVIHWDGRVTLCCKDTHLELVVGDLSRRSFREIWNDGEAVARHRRLHLAGDFHLEPICALCGNYDTEAVPADELTRLAAETGCADLLPAWAARRDGAAADPGTAARMAAFARSRDDAHPHFERAERVYAARGMAQEARLAAEHAARTFPAWLGHLCATGRQAEAAALALARFKKALDDHFVAQVAAHRAAECAGDDAAAPLEALLSLSPGAFLAENLPGLPDSAAPPEALADLHARLLLRFAIRRDIGNARFRRGDCAGALPHYLARLAEAPDDRSARKGAAFCRYHLGEPAAALELAEAVRAAAEDFEMARLAGHILLERSDFPAAAAAFAAACTLEPRDFLAAAGLAAARHALRHPAARDALLRALELAPDAARATPLREMLASPPEA